MRRFNLHQAEFRYNDEDPDGSETARVVMFSSARLPGVAVYPDSDKIAVFTEGRQDDIRAFRESGDVGYWERERL
jgi:hypothetical protein